MSRGDAAPLFVRGKQRRAIGESAASLFLDYPSLSFDLGAQPRILAATERHYIGQRGLWSTQQLCCERDGEVVISLSVPSGLSTF
jgi:hypothetical protein